MENENTRVKRNINGSTKYEKTFFYHKQKNFKKVITIRTTI